MEIKEIEVSRFEEILQKEIKQKEIPQIISKIKPLDFNRV